MEYPNNNCIGCVKGGMETEIFLIRSIMCYLADDSLN